VPDQNPNSVWSFKTLYSHCKLMASGVRWLAVGDLIRFSYLIQTGMAREWGKGMKFSCFASFIPLPPFPCPKTWLSRVRIQLHRATDAVNPNADVSILGSCA
jgi:hypothetical protein